MREDEAGKISEIEAAQAHLRDSIAESTQLAARADALLSGSRRAMQDGRRGSGEAQA